MNAVPSPPGPDLVPLRWSTERYLALVESGVIEEGRGVELIDGQVVIAMPQGELHDFVFYALQRVFAAAGIFDEGLVVQPTLTLGAADVYDPEFAVIRKGAIGRRGLPKGEDVLWTVEVAVSSLRTDLGVKKTAYAAAGIPDYWVVDATGLGIWAFSRPEGGVYLEERWVAAGDSIDLPVLGATIDTGNIFPKET